MLRALSVKRVAVIDGYLRVDALARLHRDTVLATTWSVSEVEALLHHRHLAITRPSALEDAWLLARLRDHGLTMDELARRSCRSKSWVSHRLGLLDALAVAVHDRVAPRLYCIRSTSRVPDVSAAFA